MVRLNVSSSEHDDGPGMASRSGEYDVFISYARRDHRIAEVVEDSLTRQGIRVFRDAGSITAGANWDIEIDAALRAARCLVLLLSPASMPYRKEVHREWFYFDQALKPIYPLYIESCDLHTRLLAYQYVDAREGRLTAALAALVECLRRPFVKPPAPTQADRVTVVDRIDATLESSARQSLRLLHEAIRGAEGEVVLSVAQARSISELNPATLEEYHLCRIAEWSLPRYRLDRRFVNLTLMLDQPEIDPQRWHQVESVRFNDLTAVLAHTRDHPVLALLGSPGSGKSTLLRRLQLDHSVDSLRGRADSVSVLINLNRYRAGRTSGCGLDPLDWVCSTWRERYPMLPPLRNYLQGGRTLVLLDGLNEVSHRSTADYHALVGEWRTFAQETARTGNRVLFSCRSLDYSASLSGQDLAVPQVEIQPMSRAQVLQFLHAYVPERADRGWSAIEGSREFGLYQTPYFAGLLCAHLEAAAMPTGRAGLLTAFIRRLLKRETQNQHFAAKELLSEIDYQKLSRDKWRDRFELPERGELIPALCELAYLMQLKGLQTAAAQVRIEFDTACQVLAHHDAEAVLRAATSLSLLDHDLAQNEVSFVHQILQEYFAARQLAKEQNPSLVRVEWLATAVTPSLQDTVQALGPGDPLPSLPQTGWEETTLIAAPLSRDPGEFISRLVPYNLPLAARCAASSEIVMQEALKRDIGEALVARLQDQHADVRARIAAGDALGAIGDPRLHASTGGHGEYMLPALARIEGGVYPMGRNDSEADERPAHPVSLQPFFIGRTPVTNCEYAKFIAAGGYEDQRWWATREARNWLDGAARAKGVNTNWRDYQRKLAGRSESYVYGLVARNKSSTDSATVQDWTDERFEQWLDEAFPSGRCYRQPEYWDDARLRGDLQPVVGVSWFEACAYCTWLTANVATSAGRAADARTVFRLPTEAEFEAAARGVEGRAFPYGEAFDSARCNTLESHIRRTTPVGIFNNATPEGVQDLSGNVYTWTLSIYDQARFPYPYTSDDGREDLEQTAAYRVLRGGAWYVDASGAHACHRDLSFPFIRYINVGFRLVCSEVLARPSHSSDRRLSE
jgi:formylglycine-generating enzyme required for sulfatase activity